MYLIKCANNRSDHICEACKKGYNLVQGTSQCKCVPTAILSYPFVLQLCMGVALVFLLLVCKLTVATGTLSGLVFYANIVGVNRTSRSFLVWLNLDFGIETMLTAKHGCSLRSQCIAILILVWLVVLASHFLCKVVWQQPSVYTGIGNTNSPFIYKDP